MTLQKSVAKVQGPAHLHMNLLPCDLVESGKAALELGNIGHVGLRIGFRV